MSDRNETLFYRTVMSDPMSLIPILYDPTMADACLTFGHTSTGAREDEAAGVCLPCVPVYSPSQCGWRLLRKASNPSRKSWLM